MNRFLKMAAIVVVASVFLLPSTVAQLIVTIPPFPAQSDSVYITFDATQGNGGLAGYTGDVYAHTGVITNLSASSSDWKYVKTNWGENTPETKLDRLGDNLYRLKIVPDVRSYYNVPAAEEILKIAMVFRSDVEVGGHYLEGKTAEGGDIFADLYSPGVNVNIVAPETNPLVELNQSIPVIVEGFYADSISLYVNDILVKTIAGLHLTDTLTATNYGKFRVKAVATGPQSTAADSFFYYVRRPVTIAPLPDGIQDGINYISDTSVTLCLYAPGKSYVFAPGDYSGWEIDSLNYMFMTPDANRFWVTLQGLVPSKEYIFQYLVDGNIRIGDPWADKISDPWNDKFIEPETYPDLIPYPTGKTTGIASVFQTAQQSYPWQVPDFNGPWQSNLVVYELLIRDFTSRHTYQSLTDTLDYLQTLGVNCIELMPVIEFDGNDSWGYGPSYFLAPDKYYGPKNDLKKFLDECHLRGIAVVMDIVFNHATGASPFAKLYWDAVNEQPAADNPWFNTVSPHPLSVFNDFNHDSQDTRDFVDRVTTYWLTEYKFDGYRFDLSKGFTQKYCGNDLACWSAYDASRVYNLKRMADHIRSVKPDAYLILEHFSDNNEETELANYGFMPWGRMNEPYGEAAMGYNNGASDLSWGYYGNRGWGQPNLVTFMESHDEERLMFKNYTYGNCDNPGYCLKDTVNALKRMGLAAALFYTFPGPKMLWQFGELGYDYSIDFNGRTGKKPVRWDYYNQPERKKLFNTIASLIGLRTSTDLFQSPYTWVEMNTGGAVKRIRLSNQGLDIKEAVVIGNFDIYSQSADPGFFHTGTWYDHITGQATDVASTTDLVTLQAGDYHVYTSGITRSWFNLQFPPEATITQCDVMTVYGQVRVPGVTPGIGQGSGIQCWIGYSGANTHPASAGWQWIPAYYHGDRGPSFDPLANDEYAGNLSGLNPGNYYFATRYKIGNENFFYGGYEHDGGYNGGGAWDGERFVSGTLTVAPAESHTYHVSKTGSNTSGNGSEGNPWATIAFAMEQAGNCDTVIVHPGIFTENIDFGGKRILLASEYLHLADTALIGMTIIDGGQNGSVVKFVTGETPASCINGFTLQGGHANGTQWPDDSGGGIQVINASPTLSNLKVINNSSSNCSGGVMCYGSSNVTLTNCLIKGNTAGCAAGLGVNGATVRIIGSQLSHNSGEWGKALSVWDGGILTMENCIIEENFPISSDNQPLINIAADAIFQSENLLISNNLSDTVLSLKGQGNIRNMTLAHNLKASGTGFGCLNLVPATDSRIENSILWDSPLNTLPATLQITHSNVPETIPGTGNIHADPQFAESGFSLSPLSPCIDTGNPSVSNPPATDLDGKVRIWDGLGSGIAIIDMGAYEFGAPVRIDIGDDLFICQGNTVTLDAGPGYTTYNWDNGLGYERYFTTGTQGAHQVSVTFPNGDTGFGSIVITVHPLPVPDLGGDKSICEGELVTLSAEPGFGAYLWSNGYTGKTQQVTTGGLWWVKVQDGITGCWGEPAYVNVTAHPVPTVVLPGDTTLCANQSLTIRPFYTEAQNFLWYPGGQTTSEITIDSTGIGIGSQTFKLVVQNSWNCGDSDEIRVTFIQCLGIGEHNRMPLTVFPNPTKGLVTVISPYETGMCDMTLTDLTGRTILSQRYPANTQGLKTTVNLQGISKGMYMIKVSGKSGIAVTKIMIE